MNGGVDQFVQAVVGHPNTIGPILPEVFGDTQELIFDTAIHFGIAGFIFLNAYLKTAGSRLSAAVFGSVAN